MIRKEFRGGLLSVVLLAVWCFYCMCFVPLSSRLLRDT
ncbi:hypothetical protein BofuT4_uP138650.1 [Botrytis cinerea T4]|uniref:Uncharacterized protein n=1 Tax=Botryotinia fuckeliana (strain T4) TaxID=999810 RepID=G2YMU3_BOTF4|nr:hypothetical protein BofuT4_uP138650.1 [Botrytis cinerea T4]